MASARRDLARVRGLSVGHAESDDGTTGVTVVRFPGPTPAVIDVRGGASATYDTASLALDATFGRRWAIFFAGGSVFGLDAARGIRAEILASGGGHHAFSHPHRVVPVSGAALFDLPLQEGRLPDYEALGREATQHASRRPVASGRVGAGAGAMVGKYLGRHRAMHGGLASSAASVGRRGTVGVLVVVNAVGAVVDPRTGRWVAGARTSSGRIAPPGRRWWRGGSARGTTLTLVATDLALDRPALARVASIVHAGLARTIVPYQTSTDGDVVFAAATGAAGPMPAERVPGTNADRVGAVAAVRAVSAVLAAVRAGNPPSTDRSRSTPRAGR